jgi:ATP-dependent Clp protease ATP-binding subunit ClpA
LTRNLGTGGAAPKPFIGFAVGEEEHRQDAWAPVEEAIRGHLRPELVNRLTKVVHFKPLSKGAVPTNKHCKFQTMEPCRLTF